MIDYESHHAGVAVLSGKADEGKAAHHVAIDDVAVGAAGSIFSLCLENLIIIAVIRRRGLSGAGAFRAIAGALSLRRERSKRALLFARLGFPVQPIFLTSLTAEAPRVFENFVAVSILHGILALGVDERQHDFYRA